MRIKLKTGTTSQSWDYDERMSLKEAMTIKDKLGLTVLGFTDGLQVMDPYALAALVWLVRFRAGETELDPRLIDFDLGDLDIIDPDAEAKDAAAAEAEAATQAPRSLVDVDPPAPDVADGSTTPTATQLEVVGAPV